MLWTELRNVIDVLVPVGVGVAFLALLLYYVVVDKIDNIKRKRGKRR